MIRWHLSAVINLCNVSVCVAFRQEPAVWNSTQDNNRKGGVGGVKARYKYLFCSLQLKVQASSSVLEAFRKQGVLIGGIRRKGEKVASPMNLSGHSARHNTK